MPEGTTAELVVPEHPILAGLGGEWPLLLGVNEVEMRKDATLAVSSAKVTSIAINQQVDAAELGGWRMQAEVTGKVDYGVETDEEAIDLLAQALHAEEHDGDLPSSGRMAASRRRRVPGIRYQKA